MVVLLIAGVIVEAFIDYEFKAVSVQSFKSKDNLTSFFGTMASYGGILALLFQTTVTNRLLKCAQAPPDGWMARLKRTRGAAKGAGSRHSEKDSDVTPLHHDTPHKTEHREYTYVT